MAPMATTTTTKNNNNALHLLVLLLLALLPLSTLASRSGPSAATHPGHAGHGPKHHPSPSSPAPSSSQPPAPAAAGPAALVRATCNSTAYYDVCVSALGADPSSATADVRGLSAIAVSAAATNASGGAATAAALAGGTSPAASSSSAQQAGSDGGAAVQAALLRTCAAKYEQTKDALGAARDSIAAQDYDFAAVHVGAAAEYPQVCKALFRRLRPGQYPAELAAREEALNQLCSLVQAVLSAIPTYYMTNFTLSSWAVKRIDRLRRNFLWKGSDDAKGGHCLLKILTADKVICRGGQADSVCSLCRSATEEPFHTIVDCTFSRELWFKVAQRFGVSSLLTNAQQISNISKWWSAVTSQGKSLGQSTSEKDEIQIFLYSCSYFNAKAEHLPFFHGSNNKHRPSPPPPPSSPSPPPPAPAPSSSSTAVPLVRATCNATTYYDLCVSTLGADPSSATADVRGLSSIVVSAAAANASGGAAAATALLATDAAVQALLRTCAAKYGQARDALDAARGSIAQQDYDAASVHVGAAAEYPQVCRVLFQRQRPGAYPPELAAREVALRQLCTVALDIVTLLSNSSS
ncbi:hypothetical protein U9M48_041277 [Paspalum notatum var. saurae]|uniref:Pectinesterase inhibitor domain-containing protein n=1 Tax=Paspalum notatum var. saurae TaxID=547442 RepID=A0AAQ3UQ05_PASNO